MDSAKILVNQLGYNTYDKKTALISSPQRTFSLVNVDTGVTVYEADASEPKFSASAGEDVMNADFSQIKAPGNYYIECGGVRSYTFSISDKPYDGLRLAVSKFIDSQRCGCDMDLDEWSHKTCHMSPARVYGGNNTLDVSGGWHDAGDYGRYVVPAAKCVADLLLAYKLSRKRDPEVFTSVRFTLDWMMKMQDADTGGVYHKVTTERFCGMVMPEEDTRELVVSPVSLTATACFAAAAAMAARYYPGDKERLLSASRRAWGFIKANKKIPPFKNPLEILTGEYGDAWAADEIFWAACELYSTTSEDEFMQYIAISPVYMGLGWADMGTYGAFDVVLNADRMAVPGICDKFTFFILTECDAVLKAMRDEPYLVSLGTYYPWGSNMNIANNALLLLMGDRLSPAGHYRQAAMEHVHYLLGRNTNNICYVTGFGSNSPQNPHHRPSVTKGKPFPGMLVGGPHAGLGDPILREQRRMAAPAKSYIDHADSYASNEVAIYWNSPLYCVLSLLEL